MYFTEAKVFISILFKDFTLVVITSKEYCHDSMTTFLHCSVQYRMKKELYGRLCDDNNYTKQIYQDRFSVHIRGLLADTQMYSLIALRFMVKMM